MQTGTTEKPRLGYSKGGRIQCMAEGGLVEKLKAGVNRLVGNNPTAMASRGRSAEADAPQAPQASTQAPTVDFFKKAKGGPIPKPAKGAQPHPEASGTDTVPIMATPGEFMVKKAAVDKLGPDFMEKINSVADGDKPKLGKVKRKRRGKRKGYDEGGMIKDDAKFVRPARMTQILANQTNPTNAAMVANGRAPAFPQTRPTSTALVPYQAPAPNFTIPQGTPQRPALPAPGPGTAVATQAYRPNFTMPQQPPQPPAAPLALPAPPAPPAPQVNVQRQQWQGRTGSPQADAWQAEKAARPAPSPAGTPAPAAAAPPTATPNTATAAATPTTRLGRGIRTAGNAVGPIGVGLAAIPEALDTADVAMNPKATGIDVATQASQGIGRIASAGAGAAGGAALGAMTGPLAPVAVPLGALAGGAYGYWAANKYIEGGRAAAGSDPRAPVDQLAPPPAAAAVPAAVPGAAVAPYPENAQRHTIASPADPQAVAQAVANPPNTLGQVTRIGNSYSGAPGISGDISVNGAAPKGGFVRGSGDGSFGYGGAGAGGNDAALFEARKAAIARGDVDSVKASYGGNFGPKVDPIEALINNGRPMTTRKAAAIAQLQAARAQAEGSAADRSLAERKFGVEKEGAELTNREKKGLLSAQDAYNNAKTPAERAAAEERLRAFQGKYEKAPPPVRAFAVPGGQALTDLGVPYQTPSRVFDPDTKTFIEPNAAPQPTPRTQYDSMKKGDRYIGADGKQYIKG